MQKKKVTKGQAREIYKNYLIEQAEAQIKSAKASADSMKIIDGAPGGFYSGADGETQEDYYSIPIGVNENCIGNSQYIIISKLTGKISAGWFGE